MYQRRTKPLRPAIEPLTPKLPEHPVIELTNAELRTQTAYASYLLKQERRRHAGVEKQFLRSIGELQKQVDDLRSLYVALMAEKLTRVAH